MSEANHRLVEYFVSCGVSSSADRLEVLPGTDDGELVPIRRRYRGAVVCCFPETGQAGRTVMDSEAVCTMCMPHGVRLTRSPQLSKSYRAHTFVITRADGSRIFGTVLTYFEQLEAASGVVDWFLRSEREFFESRAIQKGAAIAKGGVDDQEKQRSVASANTSRLIFASKCLCLLTSQPLVFATNLYLERFYKTAILREHTSDMPVETYLRQLLFEVSCPPPGSATRFCALNATFNICIQRPALNELPLCEYSLREMLLLFGSVRNFVRAFTCVLLERQILIAAHDYETLMLVAESLCCLLLPFSWPNVYAPILPAALLHYTDSPVPYIMGVLIDPHAEADADSDPDFDASEFETRNRLQLASQPTECLLDFAHRRFDLPDDLPVFPDETELVDTLEKVLASTACCNDPLDAEAEAETCVKSDKNGGARSEDSLSETSNRYSLNSARSLQIGASGFAHQALLPLKEPDSGVSSERASMSSIYLHARADEQRHAADEKLAHIDEREAAAADQLHGLSLTASTRRHEEKRRSVASFADERGAINTGPHQQETVAYLERMRANGRIRETVLRHFVRIFRNYDSFVIQPSNVGGGATQAAQSAAEVESAREAWFSQRELLQNFDKIAFLSDQPQAHQAFLSAFLETQLFATFVDAKVLAANRWFDDEPNWNVLLFDAWIRNSSDYADTQPAMNPAGGMTESSYGELGVPLRACDSDAALDRRLLMPDWTVAPPQLNDSIEIATRRGPSAAHPDTASCRPLPDRPARRNFGNTMANQLKLSSGGNNGTPRRTVGSREYQTATQFVDALLKESKLKTKRMVLAKLGNEARELGHAELSGLEENTLVAGLVDLLERIWNHGLQQKHGRSALWSHLVSYRQKRECNRQIAARILETLSTDPHAAIAMYRSTFALRLATSNASANANNNSLRRNDSSGTFNSGSQSGTPSLERRRVEHSSTGTGTSSLSASISGKLSSLKWRSTSAAGTPQHVAKQNAFMTPEASPIHRVKNVLSSALAGWTTATSGGVSNGNGNGNGNGNCNSQPSSRSGTLRRDGSLPRGANLDLSLAPASDGLECVPILDVNEASVMQARLESALERCALADDVANIECLKEIRTDVGYTRAFVRLALEKKMLGAHLKTLLNDTALLAQLYRRYAFLRREEEREQLLYHLLALNTVDYFAFTNTFTQTPITYRMYIYVGRKLIQWTSANVYFSMAGSLYSTSDMKLPRNAIDVSFTIRSLGFLSTLKLGHDNSGINPRWFVDYVLVRNQITGYTYRFPNGRWLGRGVDDGSSERLLVAELIGILDSAEFEALVSSSSVLQQYSTASANRCRSPSVNRRGAAPSTGARSTSVGPLGATGATLPARDGRLSLASGDRNGANVTNYSSSSTNNSLSRTAGKMEMSDAPVGTWTGAAGGLSQSVLAEPAQAFYATHFVSSNDPLAGNTVVDQHRWVEAQLNYSTSTMLSEGRGARQVIVPAGNSVTGQTVSARMMKTGTLPHNFGASQPPASEMKQRPETSSPKVRTDLTNPFGGSASTKASVSNVMELLGDAVNNVVKFYYRSERERTQTQLTALLCGEGGLVQCVELVFQFAFKSTRLFRQKMFVWDWVEKLAAHQRGSAQLGDVPPPVSNSGSFASSSLDVCMDENSAVTSFCRAVDEIQKSRSTQSVGKDGKLQILILIGIRAHALQGWLEWMSESPVTVSYYEERSFLRDKQLRKFVISILDSLNEFRILFDPSLVRGLRS